MQLVAASQNNQTEGEEWANFWELAQDRVGELLKVLQEEDFGTMLNGIKSKANLNLYSAVLKSALRWM